MFRFQARSSPSYRCIAPTTKSLVEIDADVQLANIGIHSAWRKANDRVLWRHGNTPLEACCWRETAQSSHLLTVHWTVLTECVSLWCRSSAALSAVCVDSARRTAELGDRWGTYPKSRPPSCTYLPHGQHIIHHPFVVPDVCTSLCVPFMKQTAKLNWSNSDRASVFGRQTFCPALDL